MKLERHINRNFSDVCAWNEIFNDGDRIVLQEGFLITGLLSVIFSAWLSVSLLFTSLRFDNSYRYLANFTSVACARRLVPILLHLPLVSYIETFQTFSCELFAFLEMFLSVFELECLTHICIERYVLAKYITNGWQIQKSHYYLFSCLCVFFSCLYSMPPMFGIGSFGFDFQCTACTFDLILPETWQRYFVVIIFCLHSIKPAIMMGLMLLWSQVLESKLPCSMKQHKLFTQNIIVITIANLLCWAPITMIRGSVILSQLMYAGQLPMISSFYVTWAMWINWVAPAATAIALFVVDTRLRYKMFNLCTPENEAETNDNKTD